ncbi:MAG: hypothetical protein JW919_03215 [Candidatus Omnitrophica bacterium]|nr:hypothetical protein [Candidatus Omnitrophota bacterium]
MKKLLLLIAVSLGAAMGGRSVGLSAEQALTVSIFTFSILGTLFFWDFRLTLVFVGSGALFLMRGIDLENFIKYASLDVIIFIIGMMIIVGMVKESGVFHWLARAIVGLKWLGAAGLFLALMLISAVFSALMGEATSIMVMMVIILEICDYLKVHPAPLVISSVLSTNVGSAATVLGNPVGILIALRGGFSFEEFLVRAFPLAVAILAVTMALICIWYRAYIRSLSVAVRARRQEGGLSGPAVKLGKDAKASIVIFAATLLSIAAHSRIELIFGLEENELLVVIPIIFAGIALAYKHSKIKQYIEEEVEWTSILFLMFLFALTGALQTSGTTNVLAERLIKSAGSHPAFLSGLTIFSSSILSSILDNTVVVASYIPMLQGLQSLGLNLKPLWWCLLFGACLGGNITAIGSTANIVALGVLEKEKGIKIDFIEWLKIGLIVGLVTSIIAYIAIISLPIFST